MIFPMFPACPLCRFGVALGSSYGLPECFEEASGAQEVALAAPEGAREKKVPRPDGSRGIPETENQCCGGLVVLAYVPNTLQIFWFFVTIQKNLFLCWNGPSGIPGGSRDGSKSGGGRPS